MDSFLIETRNWSTLIDISEGIIVSTGNSLKWCRGKSEDILWNWLNKTFGPKGYTKIRQGNLEEMLK